MYMVMIGLLCGEEGETVCNTVPHNLIQYQPRLYLAAVEKNCPDFFQRL